jgi:hypothetical protein
MSAIEIPSSLYLIRGLLFLQVLVFARGILFYVPPAWFALDKPQTACSHLVQLHDSAKPATFVCADASLLKDCPSLQHGDTVYLSATDHCQVRQHNMQPEQRWLLELPANIYLFQQHTWQKIPGIGARKAQALNQYIQEQKQLSTMQQLLNVKGIGPKMLKTLLRYAYIPAQEH